MGLWEVKAAWRRARTHWPISRPKPTQCQEAERQRRPLDYRLSELLHRNCLGEDLWVQVPCLMRTHPVPSSEFSLAPPVPICIQILNFIKSGPMVWKLIQSSLPSPSLPPQTKPQIQPHQVLLRCYFFETHTSFTNHLKLSQLCFIRNCLPLQKPWLLVVKFLS